MLDDSVKMSALEFFLSFFKDLRGDNCRMSILVDVFRFDAFIFGSFMGDAAGCDGFLESDAAAVVVIFEYLLDIFASPAGTAISTYYTFICHDICNLSHG